MKKNRIVASVIFFAAITLSAYDVRTLDWSKLGEDSGDDEMAGICASVMKHTQNDMGRSWLEKIRKTRRPNSLFDFGYIQAS